MWAVDAGAGGDDSFEVSRGINAMFLIHRGRKNDFSLYYLKIGSFLLT